MKTTDLEKMSHDALWDLHQRILVVLHSKLQSEIRKRQGQIDELDRAFGESPDELLPRRPYPEVQPKFRNPDNPSETWSGRGKTPRWLTVLTESGRNRDEFKVQ